MHGSLGGLDNPILTKYAVSSLPMYVLIGPDGKIICRGLSVDEAANSMRREYVH